MPNNQIQSLTVNGTTYDIVDNTSGYATEGYVDAIAPFEIHIVDYSGMGSYEYNDVTWAQIVAAYEAGKKLVLIVDYSEYYITTYEVLHNNWNEETSEYELSDFVFTYTQSNYPEGPTYEGYYTIYHFNLNSEGVWCQSTVGDEKLYTQNLIGSDTTVYPILDSQPNSSTTKRVDTDGFAYNTYMSINTGTLGYSKLILGNSTAQGTARNKQGSIQLYGSTAYKHILSGAPTADRTLTLPDNTGTIALTSDIPTVPTKTSDLTNDSGFITGMTILSYGSSTWQDFLTAYNANKIVYCRASSNSNPATGSQTRLAFMAYVNNATTPTNVEFQYYRSVSTHTESQQGDQVYVYKLDKTAGWSVTVREASVKVVAGTGLSGTYSNGTMTLDHSNTLSSAQTTQALYPIKIDVNGHISEYGEAVTIPDVSGKIDTAGTGLSKSGTTLNHSNSVTAQTTQAIYPIKIDAQGHISDYGSAVSVPTKVSELQNDSGFIISPNVVYCTCGTGKSTVAKAATIVSGSLTSLTTGAQAIVKFTYENNATNPTLKVGSTDAKAIKTHGSTAPGTSAATSWNAGSAVLFIYDGTYWQMAGWLNSTYTEISSTNIKDGADYTTGLITGRRAKVAVEEFAPVKDVTVGGTSVMSGTTAVVPTIPSNTSELTNDSHFISAIDLSENLLSTLYYLNVSGSTASLVNASSAPISIAAAAEAFRSVSGVQIAQVLNVSGSNFKLRMYDIVDADTINGTVRLVAVDDDTVYVADLADAGSGLVGTISTVSIPTVPTNVSAFTNDAGYITSAGGTATPTANTVAKFDSSAHMNSGDMSAQDVSNFVNALDAQGVNLADYVVATGVDGIWTYRKWASGLYDAWYIGSVNLLAGTAWGSGFYYHQSSSALTPPSFSLSVSSLVGSSRSAQLAMFCGVNTNYSQYWATATSGTGTIPVRLDMQGRWK